MIYILIGVIAFILTLTHVSRMPLPKSPEHDPIIDIMFEGLYDEHSARSPYYFGCTDDKEVRFEE